jgi:hypothetical protein
MDLSGPGIDVKLKERKKERQKKDYENSNISPCKKYNLQKKIIIMAMEA